MTAGSLPDIGLRPLAVADLPRLAAALDAARLPSDDIARPGRTFFAIAMAGETAGFVGLEGDGGDRLLRSLVVLPGRRGTGIGRRALALIESEAAARGAHRLHALTTTARPFFLQHGWNEAARAQAPAAIAGSAEFTGLCPASASYLTKDLRTP